MPKEKFERRVYSDFEINEFHNKIVRLFQQAVLIVLKYIDQLKHEDSKYRKGLLNSLEFAFRILNEHYIFLKTEEGKERLKASINKYPTGHRPRMGLGRGFGEIDYRNNEMEGEIMDAIRAIERYFNAM